MALPKLRRPENVEGDFFVDSSCIDCDLCRQIAPQVFHADGDQSAVYRQPTDERSEFDALKALVTCPTASIGTSKSLPVKDAVAAYPELIAANVYFCGFASASSYGASSYLIVRPQGNVLVDSPRFSRPLAERIRALGGIQTMFLTHRDDVADHRLWASEFGAKRVMHRDDAGQMRADVEFILTGTDAAPIDNDLLAIPTPGHTRGHVVLLYRNFLFTGDHVWWSERVKGLNASRSVCWYSWKKQTESMERLLEYEFEWVLPGHGRRYQASASEMKQSLQKCIARMR